MRKNLEFEFLSVLPIFRTKIKNSKILQIIETALFLMIPYANEIIGQYHQYGFRRHR